MAPSDLSKDSPFGIPLRSVALVWQIILKSHTVPLEGYFIFLTCNLNLPWSNLMFPLILSLSLCHSVTRSRGWAPPGSFQGVLESNKVLPEPRFSQAEPPQLPQPLLIRLVLQTLHVVLHKELKSWHHLCSTLGHQWVLRKQVNADLCSFFFSVVANNQFTLQSMINSNPE